MFYILPSDIPKNIPDLNAKWKMWDTLQIHEIFTSKYIQEVEHYEECKA